MRDVERTACGVVVALVCGGAWAQPGVAAEGLGENAALKYWQAFSLVPEEAAWLGDWDTVELDAAMLGTIGDSGVPSVARLVAEGAALPCDWGIDISEGPATLLPHLGQARMGARVLAVHARVAAETGDARFVHSGRTPGTSVAVDVLAMLTLARHAGTPDLLITGLVQLAIEGMVTELVADQWAALGDDGRAVLRDGWAELPAARTLADGMRGEKAAFHGWLVAALEAERPGLQEQLVLLGPALQRMRAGQLAAMTDGMGEWYDRMIDAAALPIGEREAALLALEQQVAETDNLLVALMMPAVSAASRSYTAAAIRRSMVESMLGLEVVDPATGEAFERVEGEGTVTLRSGFERREGEAVELVFVVE